MSITLRDQIITKMIEDGLIEVTSPSKKYRKITSHHENKFFWVGKMGGVRLGPSISNSISVTDYWFKRARSGAI